MESNLQGRPLSALRDEFWMIQKLGCGGFGKVYLIRNRATREYCAAKHQKWTSTDIPKLVRREMGILKKLSGRQDFVVRFMDYFEGEQQSVILTEYLGGGELFEHISSTNYELTESKCRDFARQIFRAIEFIHSRRIIHLDLKPQNIVLATPFSGSSKQGNGENASNSGRSSHSRSPSPSPSQSRRSSYCVGPCERLKLIDFGLARDLSTSPLDSIPINMCGTLEFMSPEVMRCSHATFASDLWAIGVILYMLVSGGLSPFWAGNEYRTQRYILRGKLVNGGFDQKPFGTVSKEAIDLIKKLLVVSTEQRFTASKSLEHPWLTSSYLDTLKNLETVWIRKYLARRRWQRWFNAIKALNRMKTMAHASSHPAVALIHPEDADIWLPHFQSHLEERWV